MALPPRYLVVWFLSAVAFGVFFSVDPFRLGYHLNPIAFVCSLLFIGYWNYAAVENFQGNIPTATTIKRKGGISRLIQLVSLFVCGPFTQLTNGTNYFRFIGLSWFIVHFIGTSLLIFGLFWAIWARHTLGRQWRGHVEVRSDHQLITNGPYGTTRHPIYTGGLAMTLGAVISGGGSPAAWLAFIFLTASILQKIAEEEELMGQQFKQYAQYKKTVPKLIPGLHFF